jgi:ATP-dependent exoDNAse (exonuclease V) beta subunit
LKGQDHILLPTQTKTKAAMSQPTNAFKVYQASAGSGKTYTIVREYLGLCLKSPAHTANFSQILAITFTNKAANEMKAKILQHLNDIIHSDLTKEPKSMEASLIEELGIDRASLKANAELLFQKIIHDYSSFCVSTIDAFVQKLSRSFAKDLNLPTQFNVSIDEDEVADAITERIGEQIGAANPFLTKILEDFSEMKFDNEKSSKIAGNIHDFVKRLFSEEAFQKNEQNRFETEEQYKETLDFINNKVFPFEADCKHFVSDFEAFIKTNGLTEEDFNYKTKGPCLSLLKNLKENKFPTLGERQLQVIDGNFNWYSKALAKKAGFESLDANFQQVFVGFLKRYQQRIGAHLFYRSQLNLLSLYVLRSKIKSELEAFIGEEQIVHISEFNKRINELMGDFSVPFVYERLGEHFKHLFIDEFQDTSVLQWQNLIPLLDNSLANSNMSMVVGDGKQSIYRWRNGEVGQIVSLPMIYGKPEESPAFDQFEHNLVNNFSFTELKTNHRSFENIINFNNDFFLYSANYLPEECRKVYMEKNEQFGKEVSIKQELFLKDKGFVQAELFDPKEDDTVMLDRIKELIEELSGKGFNKSDITILVRSNRTGSMIANYLNDNGIDVVSAESILLKSSDKVQLIIHTLDYLIHDDNAAVVASLLYYWHATHRQSFDGVVDGIFDRANSIAEGETNIEEELGLGPDSLKLLLAKSYSLYDLCSAMMRLYGFNTVGDAYLNFLLDFIYKWQSSDESGISSFLEYWEKKKDKLSVSTGNADAVNIMTIHKSKGLEFNAVICPFVVDDLDDKKSTTLWVSPETLGFEAIPNIDKVQFTLTKDSATWSLQAKQLAEQENAKVRLDNMNINYVAFTRPVQRLHILAYQSKDVDRSPLNAFLQDHPNTYGDPETRKAELKKEEVVAKDVFTESAAGEWFDKITIDPNPSMFWISREDKMKPQEWGEFVHQVLSEVQDANDIDHVLNPYIDSGVIDKPTASMLYGLFEQMVLHPTIYEAFTDQAKVKNECEILTSGHEILRPDRYAELPDKIILLDYKTGQSSKEHHKQLRQYMSVLHKMTNKMIESYLVYLGDTVQVVPVSSKEQ